MSGKSYRDNANAARAAAVASDLPNVREREMRSAEVHDAIATREEKSAARQKVREAESRARTDAQSGDGKATD